MMKLVIHTNLDALLPFGKLILTAALGLPAALLISSALVAALGKLPPLPFLHKTARFLPLPFSLCNSTACIPATLSFCGEKLGLREDFVKFSIPVGMQLNMDGTAFYVAITSMMLARTFHLAQDAYFFAAFFFAQFFLALTGIGFIAMPSMFVAFGIPEVAIATVIGIEPILDMCGTAQSVLGNITSSLLVGRRLGQVDEKTYGSADT